MGRVRFPMFAVTVCCACSAVFGAEEKPPESPSPTKWAVLVGIDDYRHFNDLRYCRSDAVGMRDALVEAGFAPEHIVLITDDAEDPQRRPTKANIEAQLQRVLNEEARLGDSVFVSFSGHGINLKGRSYLCPSGAKAVEPDALIPFETLYLLLARSPASQKIVVVDACRNELRKNESSQLDLLLGLKSIEVADSDLPQGFMMMSSSLSGQISIEEEEFGHGLFANYVIDGLGGRADVDAGGNRDGQVSPFELFQYASRQTRHYSYRTRGWTQKPWFKGELTGDWSLASIPPMRLAQLAKTAQPRIMLLSAEQEQAQQEYAHAVRALGDGNLPETIRRCSLAVEYDPQFTHAYRMRGLAYRAVGRPAKAAADYKHVDESFKVPMAQAARVRVRNDVLATLSPGDEVVIKGATFTKQTDAAGQERETGWLLVESVAKTTSGEPVTLKRSGWIPAGSVARPTNALESIQLVQQFQQQNQLPVGRFAGSGGQMTRAQKAVRVMDAYETFAAPFGVGIPYYGTVRGAMGLFGNR